MSLENGDQVIKRHFILKKKKNRHETLIQSPSVFFVFYSNLRRNKGGALNKLDVSMRFDKILLITLLC